MLTHAVECNNREKRQHHMPSCTHAPNWKSFISECMHNALSNNEWISWSKPKQKNNTDYQPQSGTKTLTGTLASRPRIVHSACLYTIIGDHRSRTALHTAWVWYGWIPNVCNGERQPPGSGNRWFFFVPLTGARFYEPLLSCRSNEFAPTNSPRVKTSGCCCWVVNLRGTMSQPRVLIVLMIAVNVQFLTVRSAPLGKNAFATPSGDKSKFWDKAYDEEFKKVTYVGNNPVSEIASADVDCGRGEAFKQRLRFCVDR